MLLFSEMSFYQIQNSAECGKFHFGKSQSKGHLIGLVFLITILVQSLLRYNQQNICSKFCDGFAIMRSIYVKFVIRNSEFSSKVCSKKNLLIFRKKVR